MKAHMRWVSHHPKLKMRKCRREANCTVKRLVNLWKHIPSGKFSKTVAEKTLRHNFGLQSNFGKFGPNGGHAPCPKRPGPGRGVFSSRQSNNDDIIEEIIEEPTTASSSTYGRLSALPSLAQIRRSTMEAYANRRKNEHKDAYIGKGVSKARYPRIDV